MKTSRIRLAAATVVIASVSFLIAQPKEQPKKIAYLIGVSKYDKDGLRDLDFPEKDVEALEAELNRAGFTVRTLRGNRTGDDRATKANLEKLFRAETVGNETELGPWMKELAGLNKRDVALIAFTGHGLQRTDAIGDEKNEDAFFCPVDCSRNDTATLFSIGKLMDRLGKHSGSSQNLIVIDACRDNPDRSARNIDGSTMRALPSKISMLFGSSAGQRSFESRELGHGLLTHVLLEGLRGKAAQDGEVTWGLLTSYAQRRVPIEARKLDEEQRPNVIKNLNDDPVLVARSDSTVVESDKPITLDLGAGVKMQLMPIPAGSFAMGSNAERDANAKPAHRVTISKPFHMGRTEVTIGQWKRFVADEDYKSKAEIDGKGGFGLGKEKSTQGVEFNWRNTGFKQDDEHPVTNVTWSDSKRFCDWLSRKSEKKVRLPFECEWEYACRANTNTKYYSGNDKKSLAEVCWYFGTTNGDGTRKVGTKKANAFGLHDMHGNVSEWCQDQDRKYQIEAATDPRGNENAGAIRGGSFRVNEQWNRSTFRQGSFKDFRFNDIGFRVVIEQ